MRVLALTVVAIMLLSGCQGGLGLRGTTDLASELSRQPARFFLWQEVTVPAGRARLFLQDGGVVGARNFYRPHCALEIDPIDHTGFRVPPGVFEITRVQRSTVQIATRDAWRVADLKTASSPHEGGVERFHDGYHFWLRSESEPAVMRLTCYGVYAVPADLRPPTLAEVNAALGEVGTIRVPEADE